MSFDQAIHAVELAVLAALAGFVLWAGRRFVTQMDSVAESVKGATLKLTQHDGQLAELQKAQGRFEKENEAQWNRINGVAENHSGRLTRLEVQIQTLLERRP